MRKFMTMLKETWESLPKEVRVAAFIAVSYGLSELITYLSGLKMDNAFLAVCINIFLVFLKELKPRLVMYRAAKKELAKEK